MTVQPGDPSTRWRQTLPWMREVAVIGVVYVVYSFVRNQFGSATLDRNDRPVHAFHNAVRVIDLEKALGLFHEQTIQRWFLDPKHPKDASWVVTFFNIFYGTAHFVVTLGVLIWLFVRHRERFGRWRTTLMATTVLALIGFALFPLMPPRLFNTPEAVNRYGGGDLAAAAGEPDYQFVDTLRDVGGLWSFDSKELDSISNQYAAMPSLHIGWATWCTVVVFTFARRRWLRWLMLLYPVLTLLVIVATANHYIIDAAGGLLILVTGYGIAYGADAVRRRSSSPAPPDAEQHAAGEDVLVNG
jgi:hypothetical protein